MPALVGYDTVAASVFLMRKRSITIDVAKAPPLKMLLQSYSTVLGEV